MEAGREIRVQPGVIAKVPQPQMSQMHANKIGVRTACPRVKSANVIGKSFNSRDYIGSGLHAYIDAAKIVYRLIGKQSWSKN